MMISKAEQLQSIRAARTTLKTATQLVSKDARVVAVAFSAEWLRQFVSLKDAGMQRVALPHRPKATFWGVPVDVEDYGARAKVTYSDGAVKFIALA